MIQENCIRREQDQDMYEHKRRRRQSVGKIWKI